MGTEIEKKYLVDPVKFLVAISKQFVDPKRIQQGYLSTKPAVRVRIVDGEQGYLTVKGSGLLERSEWEYSIKKVDAKSMMELAICTIEKTRYKLWNWEVDVFWGKLEGLILAEREYKSMDELREEEKMEGRPEWVLEEVTQDERYQNVNLAMTGYPPKRANQP